MDRTPMKRLTLLVAVLALGTTMAGCGGGDATGAGKRTTSVPWSTTVAGSTTESASTTAGASTSIALSTVVSSSTTTAAGDPVVLAAGDIGSCDTSGDEATAALLNARPAATVLTLGDNAYDKGSSTQFASCYGPTWGASKARTKPAVGNHDYGTSGASGYFSYFGSAAGDPAKGYYSYDLGAWHVIALNSNCSIVACTAGSAQENWLRADLAASHTACTLAVWHHPRFSSGTTHGSSTAVAPLWQALYDADADLVLQGHEHNYERFAPLNPSGGSDSARGIRSFTVGTGGHSLYPIGPPVAGSEARSADTYGVLQLTLKAKGYDWQFLPESGKAFQDSGTGTCH